MGTQQSRPNNINNNTDSGGGGGVPPPPPPRATAAAAANGDAAAAVVNYYHDNNDKDESNTGPCMPCLFLENLRQAAVGGIRRGGRSGTAAITSSSTTGTTTTNDHLGTPLPETPIYQRKRREQVKEALLLQQQQRDTSSNKARNPVYSSKYGGLEKELSAFLSPSDASALMMTTTTTTTTTTTSSSTQQMQQQQQQQARIYEGPGCEQELYAKYQLCEVIGVGSTSTVHRCVLKDTNQEFACKVIDCLLIEERFQGMMEQFQTEIEALRQLQHPGIIRLYDVYITGEKIYIVMEMMQGGELFDFVVTKGTLTEEEAAKIVRKVTSAMVYMHDHNIVHRDLKPENLLLKKKPISPADEIDVKIIDFGLSKEMEEPVARTFLGTRGYLAPEMLQRREYTKAVDTWALGVIVFVLVCGCLPFDDDSSTVPSDDLVRAKFVLRFPRWAKNLSDSAKDLLSHLLDVNPITRYTAEQALQHPWVKGVIAPKGNLLASPGRIKKSPAVAGRSSYANGSGSGGGRKHAPPAAAYTPPTPPQGPMVRKTSI